MNKGASAVIGVVLMVIITVVIAAVAYLYVSNKLGASREITKTGTFLGYYDGNAFTFVIENATGTFYVHNITNVCNEDKAYLQNFINKETTLVFKQRGDVLAYLGAYLKP